MRAVRIISWIARVALMATLVLGLLFWITQIDISSIHMLLGLTGILSLLVLGTVAVFTRRIRLLGAGSMVYALMVPVFGLTQSMILVGNLRLYDPDGSPARWSGRNGLGPGNLYTLPASQTGSLQCC